MHVKSLGIAFLFVISGCLMKNNKGGDSNNSNNEQNDPVLTECSSNLKASLNMDGPKEFIEKIEELKGIANILKVSENSYTLRALKNFSSGDPIGFAKNHCGARGEIMSLPDENCTMDTKTIDTKEYKKQCGFINSVVSKYNEIHLLNNTNAELLKTPYNLSGQLKTLVYEYISLITTNF